MPLFVRIAAALASLVLIAWGLTTIDEVSDTRWLTVLGGAWILLLVATYLKLSDMPQFPRSLIRVSLVFATVIAIVSVQLIRIQVIQQDDIAYRTALTEDKTDAIANPRVVLTPLETKRGEILDRNGDIIAGTVQDGDVYYRTWPNPATSYVGGYYSPFLIASSGLEASYAEVLTGQAANNPLVRLVRNLLHEPQEGSTLKLTLDSNLQSSAQAMLGDQNGAVVVMDARTGDVQVLASSPAYDPNQLFTESPGGNADAQQYWDSIVQDDDTPLVTRANLGLYTPGSTFKTVTAAIAIEQGYTEPDSIYEDNGQLEIDGRVLVENNRPDDSKTQWTLREGIMWSLNVVLAQVGLQIGGEEFWSYAPKFGFSSDIPFDLPVSESQLASSRDFLDSSNAVADTGFGQGQIQVSPLHMALITSAYVNDGVMMVPRLVDDIISPVGDVVDTLPESPWLSPVSSDTADDVRGMMVAAVESGSVQQAQVSGYTVGGKTGTAETSNELPHSWFIGFIGEPGENARYVVAVVLEEGPSGLDAPVGIGRDILVETIQTAAAD